MHDPKSVEALLRSRIRDVPDFPKKGILFKDVTPLVGDPKALRAAGEALAHPFRGEPVSAVAAIEARGFIFGALVARELGCGLVPMRKPGKLPWTTRAHSYKLEYGEATLHVHEDAIQANDRILLVDDLLATGGTASATMALIESFGAEVVACCFVVELAFLSGRERLGGHRIHSLLTY